MKKLSPDGIPEVRQLLNFFGLTAIIVTTTVFFLKTISFKQMFFKKSKNF